MEVIRDVKQVAAESGSWLSFFPIMSPWASHAILKAPAPHLSGGEGGESGPLNALCSLLGGTTAQGVQSSFRVQCSTDVHGCRLYCHDDRVGPPCTRSPSQRPGSLDDDPRHRGRAGIVGNCEDGKDQLGLRIGWADPMLGLKGASAVLCLPPLLGRPPFRRGTPSSDSSEKGP